MIAHIAKKINNIVNTATFFHNYARLVLVFFKKDDIMIIYY